MTLADFQDPIHRLIDFPLTRSFVGFTELFQGSVVFENIEKSYKLRLKCPNRGKFVKVREARVAGSFEVGKLQSYKNTDRGSTSSEILRLLAINLAQHMNSNVLFFRTLSKRSEGFRISHSKCQSMIFLCRYLFSIRIHI